MLHQLTRQIETVGMPELDKAVIKATFYDDDPPKEKHVLSLISETRSSSRSINTDIIDGLARRIRFDKWQVVLKVLIVTHRLIRDGAPMFIERLARDPGFMDLKYFTDDSSEDGWAMSKFIGKYGEYLIKKANNFGKFEFAVEKKMQQDGPEWIKTFEDSKLFKLGDAVQQQFDLLLNCDIYSGSVAVNPVAASAYIQLLKDSFHLYTFQSVIIYLILGMLLSFVSFVVLNGR
jgi:hypothetical protein